MSPSRVSTQTEVARRPGVSLTTASKAINGQNRVSEQTRARLLKAARELSFTPNPMARSLISGRSGTVGLIIVDSLSHRFVVSTMLGDEAALSEINLSMITSDARGELARLRSLAEMMRQRMVDGVIVVGVNNVLTPSITDELEAPVVYIYGEKARPRDIVHVPDDRDGGKLALDRTAAEQLLAEHPDLDAIACGSDQIASGVLDAVVASGRRIPEDVAITGYDNWVTFAQETDPPLTTIDMNLEALGAAAVRDLFEMVDGDVVGGGVRLHGCSLVVRGSTEAPELN